MRSIGQAKDSRTRRYLPRYCGRGENAALVAVPLALSVIELVGQQAELRLMLFPPLASIAYLLFIHPFGPHATWRGAVIVPSIGAVIGTMGTLAFRPGFFSVLIVAFITMLTMRLLRVEIAPVLAIAILPLVFGLQSIGYPVLLFLTTTALFLLFKVWQTTIR